MPGVVSQQFKGAVLPILQGIGVGGPQNGGPVGRDRGGILDLRVAEVAVLLGRLGVTAHRGGGVSRVGAEFQNGQRGGAVLDRRVHLDAHEKLAIGIQLLQKLGGLGTAGQRDAVELHLVGRAVPRDLQGIDLPALVIPRCGAAARTHADKAAGSVIGVGIGQTGRYGENSVALASDEGHPATAVVRGAGLRLTFGGQSQGDPLVGIPAAVVGVIVHPELEVDALLEGARVLGHDRQAGREVGIVGGDHGKALGGVLVARLGTVVARLTLVIAGIVAVFTRKAVGGPVPFHGSGRGGQRCGRDQTRQHDGAQKGAEYPFLHICTVSFRKSLEAILSATIIAHFLFPCNRHFHKKTRPHLCNRAKSPLRISGGGVSSLWMKDQTEISPSSSEPQRRQRRPG